MLKEERQTWILNKLHTSGKVVVSHLAGELKVSEDTIRRDLLDLDQKGQLKRVFGGAIPLEKPVINFFDRETADVALKQQLAMRALEFLEPDQLVAIDGSSTNLQFAKNIPDNLKLTVLTNSYSIAHVCSLKEQIRVIILGGDLLKDSMTTVGEVAAAQAAAYHPGSVLHGCLCHPPGIRHDHSLSRRSQHQTPADPLLQPGHRTGKSHQTEHCFTIPGVRDRGFYNSHHRWKCAAGDGITI